MRKTLNALNVVSVGGTCLFIAGATLPAAADVFTNVPEAAGYQLVYTLPVSNSNNFSGASGANGAYSVNNSASIPYGSFSRVGYYMELSDGTTSQFVYASFNAQGFSGNAAKIGVPTTASGAVYQQRLSNMNVVSNSGAITPGTGISTGNIEFWPRDYGAQNVAGVPGASDANYDFGDRLNTNGAHGSMQIHNYGAGQTLMAFNDWNGGGGALGIGSHPAPTQADGTHPDWTFAGNAGSFTVKNIQVVVGGPAQPLAPAAPAALTNDSPQLAGYKMVYHQAVPKTGQQLNGNLTYTEDYSASANVAPGTYDRVAYYMKVNGNFVSVSFDATGAMVDPTKIGIPTVQSQEVYKNGVSNMKVESNVVTPRTSASGGGLEFWPSNYGGAGDGHFNSDDDGFNNDYGYGSMQIHDLSAGETLLAYNAWGTGGNGDLGIGNRPGTLDTDWTFAGNSGSFDNADIYVLVHPTAVPEPGMMAIFGLAIPLLARRRS